MIQTALLLLFTFNSTIVFASAIMHPVLHEPGTPCPYEYCMRLRFNYHLSDEDMPIYEPLDTRIYVKGYPASIISYFQESFDFDIQLLFPPDEPKDVFVDIQRLFSMVDPTRLNISLSSSSLARDSGCEFDLDREALLGEQVYSIDLVKKGATLACSHHNSSLSIPNPKSSPQYF